MPIQKYSVTPHPVDTLLAWVNAGEIAIPEIQRPFVWNGAKVRNLLDSLYRGYPVGYLITWQNPSVRLKDGTSAAGKKILIDGQQRITALMAALLGHEVLNSDYETHRIRVAFHPVEEKFEVSNSAIAQDPAWIPDLTEIFSAEASLFQVMKSYIERNPDVDSGQIEHALQTLNSIKANHLGVIELASELDIETVTEIFIRVNSAGVQLSQADFAMSKISVNERYGGDILRKAIDYFCHAAAAPEFLSKIDKLDRTFSESEFFPKMKWLSNVTEPLYEPSYTDMLRVAFTSEFGRGKLQDLVALLSGRNFSTRAYEEPIAEDSFEKLGSGIKNFIKKTHFDRFTMTLRSAGFITHRLVRSQSALDFAYIVYLRGRAENLAADELERLVRRWYVMSILRGRYAGNPETTFDYDIRQIDSRGVAEYTEMVVESELSENFWSTLLPQQMETSSTINPVFLVYQAAQVKNGDKGFLSRDITVRDLLLNRSDVHHVFPKKYLKEHGYSSKQYNQIANLVLAQNEINISIGGTGPEIYFREVAEQSRNGSKKYGGISDMSEMRANLRENCIPEGLLDGDVPPFETFLERRRQLMARKLHAYFENL